MRNPRHNRPLGLWSVICLLIFGLSPRVCVAESIEEYTAKAALTFNFARYTDWPSDAMETSPDILRVCVEGEDALVEAFHKINGRRVGDRHIGVGGLKRRDDTGDCDLLFIGGRDRRTISSLLAGVRHRPVLTIAEIPDFSAYGGIINLYRADGKIRFKISMQAVKQANLTISSRLLRFAKIID